MKLPTPTRLPSGSWRIQVLVDGRRISLTGDDKRQLLAKAAELKAGMAKAGRAVTLSSAIDDYILARENVLSPSTVRGYRIIQRNRFQGLMPRQLSGISDIEWTRAVNQEAKVCSAKTLKNAWLFIGSVLRDAGHVPPRVTLPQVIEKDKAFLEPEDIPVFIKAVTGTDVEIPALLALSSLRCSELLALSWDNVDVGKRVIHVRGAVVPNEHSVKILKMENKNSNSRRDVPIFIPELLNSLMSGGDGLVVTMSDQTIRARIRDICAAEGLPQVGIHGLRHSFASLCYHLNVPEKVVMQIGGWSNDATMKRIYTHLAARDMEQNIAALNDFFNSNCTRNCT